MQKHQFKPENISKKPKKRKRYRLKAVAKKRNLILAGISVFLILIAWLILGRGYEYTGLEDPEDYPLSELDMNCVYRNDDGFRVYDDGKVKGIPGIDVSAYQKSIDWRRVKNAGAEFAIIRLGYSSASDGSLHLDSRYEENIKGALDAGIKVGVYFFSQAITTDEAVKEAEFVAKNLRGYDITGPVAFDMEPVGEGDRIEVLTAEDKTEIADAFCRAIESFGYSSMIYGNPSWISNHLNLSYLSDHSIWLAHYTWATDYPYKFVMWQYSSEGKVDGIEGNVDLNMYFVK